MKVPFILPLLITRPVLLARSDRVHYVRYRSGDLKMLGVCCRWRPSGSLCSISYHHLGAIYERSEEEGGCDGLPSLETQPNCVDVTLKLGSAAEVACHFAVSGDRLPNHTEGHRLNGRDALSRKAGLRLGKDSTGVEEYPNQDKLHKISVLLWDLNPGLPDGRPRC